MGSVDYLNQVVMTMDSFFKGLSDCGLLTTYEIQFQNQNVFDSVFQKKFRLVVDEFVTNLQTLFTNVGIANDEEISFSVSTKEGRIIPIIMKLNDDIDIASLETNDTSTIVVDEIPLASLEALKTDSLSSEILTASVENTEDSEQKSVEDVLSMVCSSKETSEITEPWQFSILKNEEEDTAIDTITEVMTKNHLKDMGWQCDMCNKNFSRMQNLQEHCREEHNGTGCFECNLCGTRVMTKLSLKRHIRSHSGIKTSVCSICGKTFKRSDYLATHYKLHLGARTHKCSVCGKEFTSKTNLTLHEKIDKLQISDHDESIDNDLGDVTNQYKDAFSVLYHCHDNHKIDKLQISDHDESIDNNLGDVTDRYEDAFSVLYCCHDNRKVHSDHKEYICQQCNKSFTRRDKLRDHMLRHLNIKRFQCSLCDKRYAEKRDLRTHLKIHESQPA